MAVFCALWALLAARQEVTINIHELTSWASFTARSLAPHNRLDVALVLVARCGAHLFDRERVRCRRAPLLGLDFGIPAHARALVPRHCDAPVFVGVALSFSRDLSRGHGDGVAAGVAAAAVHALAKAVGPGVPLSRAQPVIGAASLGLPQTDATATQSLFAHRAAFLHLWNRDTPQDLYFDILLKGATP